MNSNTSINIRTTSTDAIRAANWAGSIPVLLSLAPSSLGSSSLPPSIHVLLSRHVYLHIGLQSAVERLYKFAPNTLSFEKGMVQKEPEAAELLVAANNTNVDSEQYEHSQPQHNNKQTSFVYPVCWFEDEETQMALRWHLFAGVLYDMRRPISRNTSASSTTPTPTLHHLQLPWRIRLHFTSYPNSQILPLEFPQQQQLHQQQISTSMSSVLSQVQNVFKNSLKQALCLQYGNNKKAMNLTREAHGRLWDAVSTTNYSLWRQVHVDLQLLLQCSTSTTIASTTTLADVEALDNERTTATTTSSSNPNTIAMLPIRLFVDSRPPLQKRCNGDNATMTLGQLLVEWLPDYFGIIISDNVEGNNNSNDNNERSRRIRPLSPTVLWRVAGLSSVPLDTLLQHLWMDLCHPDHFLYILVLTQ